MNPAMLVVGIPCSDGDAVKRLDLEEQLSGARENRRFANASRDASWRRIETPEHVVDDLHDCLSFALVMVCLVTRETIHRLRQSGPQVGSDPPHARVAKTRMQDFDQRLSDASGGVRATLANCEDRKLWVGEVTIGETRSTERGR